jgi:hypothetical protein
MKLNAKQLANQVDVPYTTLLSWVDRDLIHPVKRSGKPRTPIEFDRKALRETKIITKLREKVSFGTLDKVGKSLSEYGDKPFLREDFLVIRESNEESDVEIIHTLDQLELSLSGEITMILPLYPIEREIESLGTVKSGLRIPVKSTLLVEGKEILQTFEGRIERIDKDVAYMTVTDDKFRQSYAECSLEELRSNGISNPYEGMMFTCNIERKAKRTFIYFKPEGQRKLSEDEIHKIDSLLEKDFPHTEEEDDF